ncbi:MAG: ABC transporter substrate-binding protein [Spongiibacteraceae bacterium]|nr:ABC transporter substrate-binding protein [Spongiibacteraceae bacterium]
MNFLQSIVVTFCVVFSTAVFAEKEPEQNTLSSEVDPLELTAHQVIQTTTERVMKIIVDAQGYIKTDPNRFYGEVNAVLDDVVDFDSFARGVMGEYASSRRYKKLKTEEEKTQFKARMKRFSAIFKRGLVQTYATGLLAFDGNKIEILPPKKADEKGNTVTVIQHIYGSAEKPYVVHYKVRRNKTNEWKLRNLTIEAINLGKVYRSQFYSAVKQHNGDVDQAIDNWSVGPDQAEAS